jgi:hypothetical protein
MSTPSRLPEPMQNGVLIEHRKRRGWGRGRLASEFQRIGHELGLTVPDRGSLEKAIYRHEKGLTRGPDDLYTKLYCAVYEAPAHELFGDFSSPESTSRECFEVQSHKFIPAYVGPPAVATLGTALNTEVAETGWGAGWKATISHPRGVCTLYGFPWGSLVYHLQEDLSESHIADVATWRHHSYPRELAWTTEHLEQILPSPPGVPEYVLSAFWLDTPRWDGPQLETAMRLLCTPRVLLDREVNAGTRDRARVVEQTFLRDGYDDQRIVDFGTYGVSLGFASWAGVSYYPLAERSALSVGSLLNLELVVQGLWCFCQNLRTQIESGEDPKVESAYGWRWLRGIRSRLTSARPQETSQESSMRVAVLQTSELEAHLASALEILRDAE